MELKDTKEDHKDHMDNRIDKEIKKIWDSLVREEKEKILYKINEEVEYYQYNEKFWSTVPFEKLPFVLKNLVKAKLRTKVGKQKNLINSLQKNK